MNAQLELHGSVVGQADRATHLNFDPAVVSSDRILPELIELNRGFLHLVAAELSGSPLTPRPHGLPDTVVRSLSLLSKEGIATASHCPYSLFDLALSDADWVEGFDSIPDRTRFPDHRDHRHYRDGRWSHFTQAALFFAWHLVRQAHARDSIYARLLLGMDGRAIVWLRAIPLAALSALAIRFSDRLTARWPQHPRFWPDLIRCSSDRHEEGLRAVRLLGRQLLAAGNFPLSTVKSRRA